MLNQQLFEKKISWRINFIKPCWAKIKTSKRHVKKKAKKSKIKTSDTAILFKIMTEKEAEQNISSEESVEENLDSDEEVILIYF